MKKALVTGANGFVGTALCKALSQNNVEVIAIVRDQTENISGIDGIKNLRIVYCDLTKFHELDTVIADRDIDVLYHLAWVGSAGPLRGDYSVQLNNIRYSCETVEVCAKMGIPRFVFASSIMEYEIAAMMERDDTPSINTLYSSAKVSADYITRTLAGKLGVEYIRAVISNIYGPGELSPRLINTSIRKMLAGEHCAFSAGEQMYDFIYIDDAAQTFVEIGDKGKNNRTYYIGSLEPKPLKEFLIALRNQIDPQIQIGLGDLEFNGVSLSYKEFDIVAVKNDTGFEPATTFEDGVQKTIEWIKEHE